MVDVVHTLEADYYVECVIEAYVDGRIKPTRTVCPECGKAPGEAGTAGEHRMVDGYVVVGCEGYFVVDPNSVGIYSPGWEGS